MHTMEKTKEAQQPGSTVSKRYKRVKKEEEEQKKCEKNMDKSKNNLKLFCKFTRNKLSVKNKTIGLRNSDGKGYDFDEGP